jgi:hypothetical protein
VGPPPDPPSGFFSRLGVPLNIAVTEKFLVVVRAFNAMLSMGGRGKKPGALWSAPIWEVSERLLLLLL